MIIIQLKTNRINNIHTGIAQFLYSSMSGNKNQAVISNVKPP